MHNRQNAGGCVAVEVKPLQSHCRVASNCLCVTGMSGALPRCTDKMITLLRKGMQKLIEVLLAELDGFIVSCLDSLIDSNAGENM